MNNIQIFEGHDVEVFELNGQILFNPRHVGGCLKLGDSAVKMAVSKMNEKQVIKVTNSKVKDIDFRKLHNTGENFLTESGVYKLILRSHKPEAERFGDWVTDEVLPSIRRNGAYIRNQENMTPEQIMAAGLEAAKKIIENKDKEINRMKPKEVFADAVATSKTSILVGELAKILKQNGADIGQNKLFAWMREKGYLIKRKGSDYNMPTQKSMEMGLFEIKETSITKPDGSTHISKTTKVTGKGQIYFTNKFATKYKETKSLPA